MNYYISDQHYSHRNAIKFDSRPFATVEEMDSEMIKKWNERVNRDDTVYILGDFCWGKEPEWIRILDQLKGKKVLIRGNHDPGKMSDELKNRFVAIEDYMEVRDGDHRIVLSHYPILFYKRSYWSSAWHFHGHTHNSTGEEYQRRAFVNAIVNGYSNLCNNLGHIINVGCMMSYVNYVPRTADELIEWWKKEYLEL